MEQVNYRTSTKSEVFRYAFGGLGSNIPFQIILTYLMFFYTDIIGIAPAVVGTLFFVTRFIDAVSDPIMGVIADRTSSRFGQYRPWLIFGAPLLGISTLALFWVPDLSAEMKIVYIYVTYISYSLISTAVNIPYHSLTPVLSEDPDQRTWLATAKQFMAIPALMCAQVLILPMVSFFGDGEQGWFISIAIFSVIIVASFWLCASSANRHDNAFPKKTVKRKKQTPLKGQLLLIAKNKPLLMLMIAMCTNLIASSAQSAVALYYWTYNAERPELFPILSFVGLGLSIPVFFLLPKFSKKFGKKSTFLYGSIVSILPFVVLLLAPYEMVWLNFSAAVAMNVLMPFTGAIPWAMLPDCVDYGEWKTGIRGAGVVSSSLTFINKLGSAVGGMIGGALLGVAGYVAGQSQSPETLRMIVYLYALLPILGHIFTIIALKFYKLDNKLHAQMLKEIKSRKESQPTVSE
ncbi:glycoside-pentoside-hexuronide (GPH):cation symporter [Gracilibacillus suaedae]|uniref:glycoside-pentoside-hexuronide (GPH):cation symporter n=1 Tax=Gracilibacillus suaedae TaxID=2820273 RepID=UPI001ABE083F|nr:glycoside-pentoside-hexuronide (GPH):cation symporter [Gracilibacillus suaedae]